MAHAELETSCAPGQRPEFVFGSGFATLKTRLDQAMGEPLTCVANDPASGDAMQWTSTGLAVYRKHGDFSTFTNGAQHWALTTGKVVQWEGGSILPQVVSPDAHPASLPPADDGVAHCGVDIITQFSAHVDTDGRTTSSSTSIGNAGGCFDQHFHTCTPATMTTYLVIASYRTDIRGTEGDGSCRVVSSYPDNPNPRVLGQEMTCDLDPDLPFAEAATDHSRCSGPLFNLIWAGQVAP